MTVTDPQKGQLDYKVYTENEDFRKLLNRKVFVSTFLIEEATNQLE